MHSRARTLVVAVALIVACTGSSPPRAEICDNRRDDNDDGKVDCLDPGCFETPSCVLSPAEDCTNGVDDDANGRADCRDDACEGAECGAGCLCLGGEARRGAGGGSASTGGGASSTGGGSSSTGGGSSGTGGGSSSTGGGASSTGGGSSSTGGGSSSTGGGSSSTGGGTSSTGGGTSSTGGGSSSTGGGSSATGGGASATGGGSAAPERNCNNNMDDDGDNATDCDDPDCVGITCGMGCSCALGRRTEVSCSDNLDNDGDAARDCADPDCQGAGTEICNDGVDNTCDRAIDCGDPKCTGQASCSGVQDGLPCLTSAQCASGRCLTEAQDGLPNGLCTNASPCSISAQTGCNGGRCIMVAGTPQCRASCTGNGLGGTGRCRQGYFCVDSDTNPSNGNNTCRAMCTSDADCAGNGPGFGCNPWSKACQNKDRGRGRYGDACTTAADCESELCATGQDFPGGYCGGWCRADTLNCGPNGSCQPNTGGGDNSGICFQACTGPGTFSTCRATDNYKCWPITGPAPGCSCQSVGALCGSDSDCCTNFCNVTTCVCIIPGGLCVEDRECCSGLCAFGFCSF